tara:strand:- start:201 stop:365 length:165 start_codon:yes stop_codon:yes gene_type:complete
MIALRDFILKYYCKERSRVYLGWAKPSPYFPSFLRNFGFLNPKLFGKKVEVEKS